MDGTITIGTRIDESGFDKDYKKIESEIDKIRKENAVTFEVSGLDKTQKIEKITERIEELKNRFKELAELKDSLIEEGKWNLDLGVEKGEGYSYYIDVLDTAMRSIPYDIRELNNALEQIGGQGDTGAFENLKSTFDDLLIKGDEAKKQWFDENYAIEEQVDNTEEIVENTEEIKNNTEETKNNTRRTNNFLEQQGKSLSRVIRTVKRWAFSLLGISTAYSAMRKVINLLSEDNEQFKADIQYIGWGLKQAVLTVLESIGITAEKVINVIKKLLFYIAYIIKQWTGKNIFENASLDKYNKSLKKTSSGLKEIRKQLAGFDEANVLNANTGQVNGLGSVVPSFNFGDWADEFNKLKPPSWVEWIAENKFAIQTLAEMALGIFGVATIASWVKNIAGFLAGGELGALGSTLTNLGVIAGGIVITYICAKQVWDDLERLQGELLKIADNGYIGQEKWLETEPAIKQVHDTWMVNIASTNDMYFDTESVLWDILSIVDLIMGRDDTRLELAKKQSKLAKQQIDYVIKEYNKGELTKEQRQDIVDMIQNQIKENNIVIEQLKKQGKDTSEIEGYNRDLAGQLYAVKKGIEYNKDETEKWWIETGKVKTNFDGTVELIDEINNTDLKDKTVDIKADKTLYDSTIDSIEQSKNSVDVEVNANTQKLKTGIVGAIGAALGSITVKPLGVAGLGALAGKTLKNLFKFAKGGIINQPGRGIPIGYNAIAGEAGREGILPLTDAQQMELLGQSIGKYVQIDNVIDINMDSYKINRILKQSQERANFSANR